MGATPREIGPLPAQSPVLVPPPRAKHNSRRLAWGIGIGLALALAVGATLWRTHQQNSISYESVPVERGPIQAKVNATGNLNAVVDVLVSSQVSGNIKALYADWNSKVKKGQLVALIDPQIFQSQLDQASASYRSASAATISARAQVEKAKSDLSSAIASEKNAEAIAAKDLANEVNARSQWKRAEALLQEKIMNQQDYELAKANYAAARAQVTADRAQADAARQNILSAQASVRVAESQAATALAQEHEAQAVVKQARINLDHTRIMAPVDGTVIARRMDVGQTVASTLNPPTIFEIAQDLTKMQVDTNLDESDVGSIAKGQRAAFVVDSYPETTFEGVVADIRKAPIITQNVVTYDVVISVNNSEFKLFPGMTANVTIQTGRVEDTLKVPTSVLRFRPSAAVLKKTGLPPPQADKPQVYVLAAGKISAVPVKFGLTDGKYIAVRSDQLRPGERVVIRAIVQGSASSGASSAPPPMGPRM